MARPIGSSLQSICPTFLSPVSRGYASEATERRPLALGIYGSMRDKQPYEVTIELIDCASGRQLAKRATTLVCQGTTDIHRVAFREPVAVAPNSGCIASALIKGCDGFYGGRGLRKVSQHVELPCHRPKSGSKSQKALVTFTFSYAAGCNNGTSIGEARGRRPAAYNRSIAEDGQLPEIFFCLKKV